jgi:hypothetical protein
MPSPFPGMDPYIEHPEIWSDFHLDLAAEIRTQLNQSIQPRYVARLNPRVTYEVVEVARMQSIRPDVGVWQPQPPRGPVAEAVAELPPAPVVSTIKMEVPLRLVNVEVRKSGTLELVTAIEILSPVNKQPSHEAYLDYLRKRRELLRSAAHLVEIDLLRGGERPPLDEPAPPAASYYVTLSRAEQRPEVEVWPIQLQDRLPIVPIPLSQPDPDASLDLAVAVAAVYERGGYATLIDYHRPPPAPKLPEVDALWLDRWLRQQEIR